MPATVTAGMPTIGRHTSGHGHRRSGSAADRVLEGNTSSLDHAMTRPHHVGHRRSGSLAGGRGLSGTQVPIDPAMMRRASWQNVRRSSECVFNGVPSLLRNPASDIGVSAHLPVAKPTSSAVKVGAPHASDDKSSHVIMPHTSVATSDARIPAPSEDTAIKTSQKPSAGDSASLEVDGDDNQQPAHERDSGFDETYAEIVSEVTRCVYRTLTPVHSSSLP